MRIRQPRVEANAIDRVVSWFAPRAGLERLQARAAVSALLHFEGASKGRRTAGWRTPGTSATTAAWGQLATLRNRSRDLTRNNSWAKRALGVITNNVVGQGITPRVLGEPRQLRELALDYWRRWAVDSTELDARGRHNIYGLQALVMRTVAESGEALIRRRRRRSADGLSVPLQLEVLEPDYLDTSRLQPTRSGNTVREGVETDQLDRVVGYWLYRSHPGDAQTFASLTESRFVPASEILHVFDEERAGQLRGIPFPHAAIIRLRDLDETDDAQLVRIKVASCFVALVHDIDASRIGEAADDDDEPEKVEPAMFWHLPPGKDVKFGTPPSVGDYPQFSQQMLRGVAAAYGITYEQLSGDYSGVNFSSGRMGWIEADRNVRTWQRELMVLQVCSPLWAWFAEALELAHGVSLEGLRVSWQAPRREMLDPVKETTARKLSVRSGFQSLSDAIRETGRDPRETLEELAQDADMLDELGLKLDTHPRMQASSGPPPPGGEEPDDEDEPEDDEGEDEEEQDE